MKENKKFLFLCGTALTALLAAGVMSTTSAYAADSTPQTSVPTAVKATQSVEINKANFPDDALRAAMLEIAKEAATDSTVMGTSAGQWDGKSLTPEMLNYITAFNIGKMTNGEKIKDLEGLQYFPGLTQLTLKGSGVTDLSQLNKFSNLTTLYIGESANTGISGLKNSNIKALYVYGNSAQNVDDDDAASTPSGVPLALDLTGLTGLTDVTVYSTVNVGTVKFAANNKIENADFAGNQSLSDVNINDLSKIKKLTLQEDGKLLANQSLDLTKFPSATSVDVESTALSGIITGSNSNLTELTLNGIPLDSIDLTGYANLKNLDVSKSGIKNLDLSKNPKLSFLAATDCNLTSLDLSKQTVLSAVSMNNNKIKSINLGSNQATLRTLMLSNNQLTGSLDLSNITNLDTFEAESNKLTAIDFTNDVKLSSVLVDDNELTSIDVSKARNLQNLNVDHNHIAMYVLNTDTTFAVAQQAGMAASATGVSQTLNGTTYEAGNHWYFDLGELVGTENLDHVSVSDTNWKLASSGVAEYVGKGQPTTIGYSYGALRMTGLANSATDSNAVVTLTPTTETKNVSVSYKIAADFDDGVEHGHFKNDDGSSVNTVTNSIEVGTKLTADLLPTTVADSGYKFKEWEELDGTPVDLTDLYCSENKTLYAVFEKQTESEALTSDGYADGYADGSIGEGTGVPSNSTTLPIAYVDGYSAGHLAGEAKFEADSAAGSADQAKKNSLNVDDVKGKSAGYIDGVRSAFFTANEDSKSYMEPASEAAKFDVLLGLPMKTGIDNTPFGKAYTEQYEKYSKLYEAGRVAGLQDSKDGKTKTYATPDNQFYDAGYDRGFIDDADAKAGTLAGDADGSAAKNEVDNQTKSKAYQDAYDAAYKAAVDSGKYAEAVDKNRDAAAGTEDGKADGLAGRAIADLTDKTVEYTAAYQSAYKDAKQKRDQDYADGLAAGTADVAANKEAATETSSQSSAYWDGYRAAFDKKQSDDQKTLAADTAAGATAGTNDAIATKQAAKNSDKSAAYQTAYTAAYVKAAAEYAAAESLGYADAQNGEVTDTTGKSEAYIAGYEAGRKQFEDNKKAALDDTDTKAALKAAADYAAGQAAGATDGSAGKTAADTTSESADYQAGYTAGYAQGKAAKDAAAAKAAAAAQSQADTAAGTAAGIADADAAKAAADTTGKSADYQAAYKTAYAAEAAKVAAAKTPVTTTTPSTPTTPVTTPTTPTTPSTPTTPVTTPSTPATPAKDTSATPATPAKGDDTAKAAKVDYVPGFGLQVYTADGKKVSAAGVMKKIADGTALKVYGDAVTIGGLKMYKVGDNQYVQAKYVQFTDATPANAAQSGVGTVKYPKHYGIQVFKLDGTKVKAADGTFKKLASGTKWKIFGTPRMVKGMLMYCVGGNQYVMAEFVTFKAL